MNMKKTSKLLIMCYALPLMGSAPVAQQHFVNLYKANKIEQLKKELEDAQEALQDLRGNYGVLIKTVSLFNRKIEKEKEKLSPRGKILLNFESLEIAPRYIAYASKDEPIADSEIRENIKRLETERNEYISWFGESRKDPDFGWRILNDYHKTLNRWRILSKQYKTATDQLINEQLPGSPEFVNPEELF